jgi:hypothetical protein
MEATPHFVRRVVIVLVNDPGQSATAALRYARSLQPTTIRAVHFVRDSQRADRLRSAWPPGARVPLKLANCHGRTVPQCAADLVRHEAEHPGAQVTVVVPRRGFSPPRDGTASQIADALSQVPDVAVTIIPPSRTVPESRGHSEPS